MKKLPVLILAILLLLSLCACAQKEPEPKPTQCPHDYVIIQTVAATCTTDGYDEYQCSLCGRSYKATTEKAPGHTPERKYPETKRATCIAEGYKKQKCSVCGEEYKEILPKVAHEYKNHICTMCGDADKPMFFTDMKRELKSGGIAVYSANIHNYTGKTLEFVEVTLELLDKKGNIIDTDWTYAVGSEGIKNKSKAYFDIWYSGVVYYDVDSWVLRVKDYDVAG